MLAVAGIGVFIVTRLLAGTIFERIDNQLADSVDAAGNAILEVENQQLAVLRLMSFTEGLSDATLEADTAELRKLLLPNAANSSTFEVIVFDLTGEAILYLREDDFGTNYDEVPLDATLPPSRGIARVVAGESDTLGDKFVDIESADEALVIYFTAPITDDDNVSVGGLSIGITANALAVRVGRQALSEIVFYAPDGEIIGTTFPGEPSEALIFTEPEMQEFFAQIADRNVSTQLVIEGTEYEMLYTPLVIRGEMVGVMAVALSSDFVVDRISTSRDVFTGVFTVFFLAVAVVGIVISRSITTPLDKLVATTRAIREGDLSRRVSLTLPDELGELGNSFDHMAGELVARNAEINSLYQEQLIETARRNAMLTSIGDALLVVDLELNFILINDTAQALLTRLESYKHDLRRFYNICQQREQVPAGQNITLADRFFDMTITPVIMDDGTTLGHVVVFHDITEVITGEQFKHQVVMQISHELRTPLTALRGYIDLITMLQDDNLTEQQIDFLGKGKNQVDILQSMSDRVISVTRVLSGKYQAQFEDCEIDTLIEEILDEHAPKLEARHHSIKFFAPPPPVIVECDVTWMKLAIDNLVQNAVNYTLEGGEISVSLSASKEAYVFIIKDTGVGIAKDEQDKVFEMLYRGSSADAGPTDTRGLGMGLFLVKHVIEMHRGKILLDSKEGVGTMVQCHLPRQLRR